MISWWEELIAAVAMWTIVFGFLAAGGYLVYLIVEWLARRDLL